MPINWLSDGRLVKPLAGNTKAAQIVLDRLELRLVVSNATSADRMSRIVPVSIVLSSRMAPCQLVFTECVDRGTLIA